MLQLANLANLENSRRTVHHDAKGVAPTALWVDCMQPLLFLLVIERLERAGCATARENGASEVDGRALPLSPVSQLLWTRKESDCVQSALRAISAL